MRSLGALIKRNTKLFFKDKGMFFTSLITPAILLVLYATFLAGIYRDSFVASIPQGVVIPSEVIDGCVGGQLFASLLAVSCITVSFCSNFLMVQDKVTGARSDLTMTPVKKTTLAMGYYVSTLISTLIVCVVAVGACFIYLAFKGWYLTALDILLIFIDIFLLVMFGTALSSIINHFLTSQGQISAVGSIVSAGYGFICGAYMPISQFGSGLQTALSFLPGTYGTALLKNHALRGAFAEMLDLGIPKEAVEGMKAGIDCSFEWLGHEVSVGAMYAVLIVSVLVLVGVYVAIHVFEKRKKK